jgi:hypothetical protein
MDPRQLPSAYQPGELVRGELGGEDLVTGDDA